MTRIEYDFHLFRVTDQDSNSKKNNKKTATKPKSQSSSVTKPKPTSKVDKVASKSTFLGGGASVQKVQQTANKPKTVKKPATPKKTVTTQDRINQKSYGTTTPKLKPRTQRDTKPVTSTSQRKKNAEANMNLKQTQIQRSNAARQERRTQNEVVTSQRNANREANLNLKQAQIQKSTVARQERRAERATVTSQRRANRDANLNLKQTQIAKSSESNRRLAGEARAEIRNAITDNGAKFTREEDRRARQNQKSGIKSRNATLGIRESATGETIEGTLRQVIGGHLKSIGDDSNELQEYKDMLDDGVANGRFTRAEADRALRSMMRNPRYARYEGWEDSKQHETYQKIFKKGTEIYDKGTAQVQSAQEGAGRLKKAYLGALGSGIGMATDMLAGPAWMVSMTSRTYGGEIGNAEKEGATRLEDRRYAGLQALKEVGTEGMFSAIGLSAGLVKGRGLFDSFAGRLTNRVGESGIRSALRKYGMGIAEENLEEVAGWALDPAIKNLSYGNNLWARQVRQSTRDEGDELRSAIASMDENSVRAMAAHLNSDSYLKQIADEMKANGATDDEAREMALTMQAYMNAVLTGNKEAEAAYENEMVRQLKGKNPNKATLSWSELGETLASTTLLTGVTGIGGTISTAALGNTIKQQNGISFVKNMADKVKLYDIDNSSKGQAVSDHIASGRDVAGTQVADITEKFEKIQADAYERYQTSNQTKETLMRREDLRVQPRQQNADGTYSLGEITDRAYDEYTREALDYLEQSGMDITQEDAEMIADAYGAYMTGVINPDQMAVINTDNAAARTLFSDLADINFNEYTVRDRRGIVDTARTNINTEYGLYAKAADNYVGYARLEQNNWNDTARGVVGTQFASGLGTNGNLAIQHALNTVDPRDRGKFMLTGQAARRVYEYARNTNDTWEQTKRSLTDMFKGVDETAIKFAFNAAKEDKAKAETAYYGKIVDKNSINPDRIGIAEGTFTNESERLLKGSEVSTLSSVARELGINVVMSDSLDLNENGRYSPSERTITLNSANTMGDNLNAIFSHEVTHHLAAYAPDEYVKLSRFIMDRWFKEDSEGYNREIQRIQTLYKNAKGQELSNEEALEELIADGSRDFWTDEELITSVTAEEPSLAKTIIDAIKDFLSKLRAMLSSGEITDEATRDGLFAEIDAYDEAYKLWMNAYNAARKAQADQAIAEWQDNANRASIPASNEALAEIDDTAAIESGEISAGFGEERTRFSVREEDPPQNTIKAYKVFVAFKNRPGELYPPMVASPGGMPTPVGRWINADTGELARNKDGSLVTTKKGRVKVQEGGKGTNKGKGGSLAWRPGWHLGSYPDAKQFAVKDPETGEARTAFPPNFVWAECEIAADNDYQIEALSYGVTEKGKFDRTQAGLPYIPKDGYYKYRTNADPNTVPWLITGAMKVNRILDDEEAREICAQFGATPMKRAGGDINLAEYGFEKGDVTPTSDEDLAKLPPAVDYSDEIRDLPGYVQRDINFDDPQIQKELAMNGQDADYYKGLYNEQKFGGEAQVRFSITPQQDADYMKAVESNDMDTAQRMVDEAAEKAMPNTKLKGRWYHGTENEFTVFNFSQGGKNGTADGYGIYLTNDPKVAESYGQRMIEGYVNVERPASALVDQTLTDIELHRLISRTVDVEAETLMYDEGYDNAGDAKKDTWISNYTNTHEAKSLDDAIDDVVKTITQFNGNDFDIIQEIMNGMGIRDYEQATAFYDILTEETGIDGFETKWGDESEMADPNTPTIALAFRSEQIKDASPVTYDDDGKPIPLSDRFDMSNEDIRFSLTPEQQQRDADYMDAVNSGNMEEAQRFVDEAAKAAGYDTRVYHGTSANFTVFDPERSGQNWRGYSHYGKGLYFSDSEKAANDWGKYSKGKPHLMNAFIDLKKPFDAEAQITDPDLLAEYNRLNREINPSAAESYAKLGIPFDKTSEKGGLMIEMLIGWTRDSSYSTELLKRYGYDGVKSKKTDGTTEYVVFDPEQIKSADPVTYAEDGSVIPLSERFDPTNNDIRYSLPTQDSDGNILTDGQMEYFKNSQARDIFGRLVPVYHATDMGGFTIFDPWKSDDHRSLFFSSKRSVAQTYVEKHLYADEDRLGDESRDVQAWDDLIDLVHDQFIDAGIEWENETEDVNLGWEIWNKSNGRPGDISYDDWIRMTAEGDPELGNYTVSVTIPYAIGEDVDSVKVTGNDMADLLKNVSSAPIPHTGYYQVYLNLENPLIIDGQGAEWYAIPSEGSFIKQDQRISVAGKSWLLDQARFNDERYRIGQSWRNGDDYRSQAELVGDGIQLDLYGMGKVAVNKDVDAVVKVLEDYFGVDANASDNVFNTLSTIAGSIVNHMTLHPKGKATYDYSDLVKMGNVDVYDTREWAEIAQQEGHDGVIFRNIVDIDNKTEIFDSEEEAVSDIYVVFSSNQVKDTRNENPTENPDIRYSITPEDEAMSRLAYEDAMDDSYVALQSYEASVIDGSAEEFFKGRAYAAGMDEESISRFYDALRSEDAVPSADAVFEADRVRRARSKEDFFNNVNAKWNDRWTTEGEVLDLKSVKKDITNLVKGVMTNSDTDAQYRNEIVRQTLLDVRTAYQLMKQDRSDVASYLLYHSAQRMIEGVEFIRDDTAFKEYKEIRDFLRGYRINAPEEYWHNVEFNDFRKEYYGRLRIGKGPSNIEAIYSDCQDRWPHLFNEEEREKAGLGDSVEDLLQHIGVVVDSNVTPFMEAYSSEEAVALAYETADALYDIMAGGDRVVSLADSYKERFDEKTKAMKQRHAEAILRERKIREDGIRKERQKFREYKERQKEKSAHSIYFDRITKNYKKLTERLLTNTADKHIPEQYKKELAKLLAAFDLQTVRSKNLEAKRGYKSQTTLKMNALKSVLQEISSDNRTKLFHVNDSITDIIDSLSRVEGETIDELSASDLREIDKLLRALLHEFNTYESVRVGVKRQQAADIGRAQVENDLRHANKFGAAKDYQNGLGRINKLVNMDEMTPAYLFKRIDPNKEGLGLMYQEIRKSFDKYVRNTDQLNQWMEEIVGEYHDKGILWNKYGSGELTNWRSTNYQQDFRLTNGTVTLTPAQMMSLYCLSKRPQAYGHMVGAGIVVAPVSFQAKQISDIKPRMDTSLPVILTDADIKQIVSALTPEQVKVADKLQELMATKMAAWGNDASMRVLGIELFTEKEYFPIRSDKAALTRELNDNDFVEAIRNFGFTKAVQPGARNAIMIDDIFDVVTEHCNNMNLYNSYSEAMNDFMKVYNYRHFTEEGREYTVQQSIAHAYSRNTATYIMNLLRDLNGNVSGRSSGIEDTLNKYLANAKKASVFANGRVALQQPTAIARAFAVISPKYLKGVKIEKGVMDEMFEHCPIAKWKSWGYYDINMGRSIEDVIMNNGSWLEDKATDIYGALDNVTWTAIWQMVKDEMKDTHPNVKVGTEEYWELCNERMSEIVDLTQVVDSPLHRSDAMRNKSLIVKMFTSFMAEPTLTFNMVRDGLVNSLEAWKSGNKREAGKIAGRTLSVFIGQAALVSAAAAIWDAVRGKNPGDDDDDDPSRFRLWWLNTIENFKDNINLLNNIYYVKEITPMIGAALTGGKIWEPQNLAMQGWTDLATGLQMWMQKMNGESKKSWWDIDMKLFGGLGSITGVPAKTLMRDSMAIYNMFGLHIGAIEDLTVSGGNADADVPEEGSIASRFIGTLLNDNGKGLFGKMLTTKSDNAVSESSDIDAKVKEYRESLPDTYTDEQKDELVKQYKKRIKKETANEEVEKRDRDTMLFDAEKAAAGYEGSERDKRIWQSVSKGYKSFIEEGNYERIMMMRRVVEELGGDLDYFDTQVNEASKTALKKSIKPASEMTEEEFNAQRSILGHLRQSEVPEEEIRDYIYKSETRTDLQVAMRINDEDAIFEELTALVNVGFTQQDFEKAYKNRNRVNLKNYKDKGGKYSDRLKSMGTFIWPTDGVITSHFGYRNAPTRGASSNHPAIDIGAPQGTAVVAADGGVVISAGANGGYGNSVGIKHDNGMITWYNHLYDWNVKVGDTVAQGQQIAQVGSTGISTGPHLDFKIMDTDGNPVDPEKYLDAR